MPLIVDKNLMKTYDFAPISAREYPTVKILDHPYIWAGVKFCVNLSERPYSSELVEALATHGIEWIHCPVSEEPGADWLESFARALPQMYKAYKEGKNQIVHCDLGNNRSKSLVETFHYLIKHSQLEDEYKGEINHLAYNCKIGHLPPLEEVQARLIRMILPLAGYEYGYDSLEECMKSIEKDFLNPGPSLFSIMKKTLKRRSRKDSSLDDEVGIECGTPLLNAVYDAVEDFKNGRPVGEGITVDEVQVIIVDDWAETGCTFDDNGPVPIYAPLMLVNGESKPERLFQPTDIDGFTPARGHEYQLRIRRIYLTNEPFYHNYEMLELISDKPTQM